MDKLQSLLAFDIFYKEQMTLDMNELSLSEAECDVLLLLDQHESLIARKIESYLKVDRGYLSRILNRLGQHKLIERIQDKKDKRVYHIKLTKNGKEKLSEVEAELFKNMEEKYAHLSRDVIVAISEKLEQVMDIYNRNTVEDAFINQTAENINNVETFTVRPGTTGDAGFVLTTHSDYYQDVHDFNDLFVSRLLEEISEYNKGRFNSELFILCKGDKRIGSIIVVIDSYNNAQLGWFIVKDEYDTIENKEKLLKYALDYCKEVDVKHIFTTLLIESPELESLLKSYDFTLTSKQFSKKWKEAGTTIKRFETNLKVQ
ncbi:MarR family winged helix-turn-helix transcriptional regulator [Phocicoccus pinnipedialis]|uniref:HTH marR-type domain-containing protein n=1 Tax=Phocicoccus pinnipedialis TaxID=110845 RepID=A0A6V7REB4_9BACL|nr:MarR family transcriptional regulator [Jeotgalicoccus pinnipedialis]MBP1939424.1 DNA-binding MarR family transcriptional regulator [Jeotgalicoccus pinnipedialis]CAD2075448.1 hypothetical protein JEOPIN946_01016 [Jeotgalicoccus pinnipedialis]